MPTAFAVRRSFGTLVTAILSLSFLVAGLLSVGRSPAGAQASGTLAPGATADWPQFHSTPDRVGVSTDTSITVANVDEFALAWSYKTGGEVWSSPAVVGGTVYFGSDDTKVYAMDAATGAIRWTFTTGGAVRSSPAVANGTVYVGSNDKKVYALNASTGAKIWSFATGGQLTVSAPLVVNGKVYVGSTDKYFYALDANTGAKIWSVNTWEVRAGAAFANGTVYVGSDKKLLWAFDANTGATKWTASTGNWVRSTPSVSGGIVYVGSDDFRLYAFDASTGALKWKTGVLPQSGIVRSSPAVANGLVYINTGETTPMDSHEYAFNALTGVQVWNHEMADYATASPVYANGVVITASFDGQVYAFDAALGTKLWVSGYSATEGSISNSPAVANGSIYVGSQDHGFYAFANTPGDPIGDWVSITDNLFNPVETFGHRMGTAVKWTNLGPSSHKVKDSTGLGLFSSPSIPIGGTYQYTFIAACIFKYEDPGHSGMTGTVKSQVDIEPFSGTTSTTFTITWASQSAPSGFVYDVQIQRPGESSYSTWKNGVTGKSATFKPDSGTGNYRFQARMRSTSSGKSCNYSPYRQVAVS